MTTKKHSVTRRSFVKGMIAAGAAPYIIPASALGADGRPAPSNRIVMGFIGVGGQGSGDMGGFMGYPEVQIVAVCDVDATKRASAKKRVEDKYGKEKTSGAYKGCEDYNDFRDVVRRSDIDAIFCATPDHWHALVTVEAMRNGKDVYCEKPETLTIREGRMMVDTARRYGRVFSGGSQRVWEDYNWYHKNVYGGVIGEVKEAWVNISGPSDEMLRPAQPVPEGFDWDRWLGPAPYRPYNKEYHPFNWRWCRDYSGGSMTDWGAHHFGGAMFCMNMQDGPGPLEVTPEGRDFRQLTYKFASGLIMHNYGTWGGPISFRGTNGEIPDRKGPKKPAPDINIPNYKGRGIFGDFLYCVKTRERPFRDIERAFNTLIVCHLGNIATWLRRPIKFDPDKKEIIGDPEANRWIDRPKRAPWTL
ncbi:MAG: Gfo/Idh/MocA family oxidoreductase [Candidatus Sumerlaeota bacterium]|nr:Gfo/Idh/MocA family oxidoreductase [Candidatus Sumerlaeota bacterium]